jgi:hypothetical protein
LTWRLDLLVAAVQTNSTGVLGSRPPPAVSARCITNSQITIITATPARAALRRKPCCLHAEWIGCEKVFDGLRCRVQSIGMAAWQVMLTVIKCSLHEP